jgi:hypothetical protein
MFIRTFAARALVAVLLFAAFVSLAGGATSASAGPMSGMKTGDLNGDADANSLDALLVMFYDAGLSGKQSMTWQAAADVNCDLSVNTVDATLILQDDAGLYQIRP